MAATSRNGRRQGAGARPVSVMHASVMQGQRLEEKVCYAGAGLVKYLQGQ